ncbi:hypothetical protein [Bradyrhizobium betae]|uniref:Uncharacterized protein n=1 Tax=Bradyrhizobium betae TaxID=244734 RepID=A0A5P6PBP3_9BRAD|nr:hypothetical protein [Bradyrhizobium betae]MCS3730022.1 hypothetical protein [Bradyrhizobium betae]QFI75789.1 hypothetical protein F8237_27355 [Bradyrhizobium betae]
MRRIAFICLAGLLACSNAGDADAQSLGSTNELARKAADEVARGFNCDEDEVQVIGTSGRAVELATRR